MTSPNSTIAHLDDNNDYDGSDLCDIIAQYNLTHPRSWLETNTDLDVSPYTMENPADITSITAKDWQLI